MNNKVTMEQKNKLIPELRFPEFMKDGEWKENTLEKISDVYQPKTISQTELKNEGFLVYGANGIIGFYNEYNHETEQIAITCRGNTCGTVNYTKAKSWITGNAMVINVDKQNDVVKKFIYYNLFNTDFTYLITGSGQPQITGNIKLHKILIPKINEQQKIADCLSSLDELITAHNDKLETLKNHKKGLLQNLFPQENQKVPNYRFQEFVSDGEWEEKSIEEISLVNPTSDELPKQFIYIDLESVERGVLKKENKIYLEEAPSRAQRLLKTKDVIYQMVRPYQMNNYFFNKTEKEYYVASTGYAQLRAKESPEFLFQLVHTETFVGKVLAKCTGSNYPAINSSDLKGIKIQICKPKEQQKIADCLMAVDNLIAAQTEKIEQLKAHKKGLMQGLFP